MNELKFHDIELNKIKWIYPVGCYDREDFKVSCRKNLKNFLRSLEKDLDEKLTIIYIPDVGMNKRTWEKYYSENFTLTEKMMWSKIGSKRYYVGFPGLSAIKAEKIFYMSESGGLEPSIDVLGLEPNDDLFPEPCVMIQYNDEIKPCYTFGDDDLVEYQFMLDVTPRKYGIEGVDIKTNCDGYYCIQEYQIPDSMSLYILFSTTCLDQQYKAKKYIIGGYKVEKIYVQQIKIGNNLYEIRQFLREHREEYLDVIKNAYNEIPSDDRLRLLSTEDVYTVVRDAELLVKEPILIKDRSEIIISLGEIETAFYGAYFIDNPIYEEFHSKDKNRMKLENYSKKVENDMVKFKNLEWKKLKIKFYELCLEKKLDCILKLRRFEKGKVKLNPSYGILISYPETWKSGSQQFGQKLIEEILKKLQSLSIR